MLRVPADDHRQATPDAPTFSHARDIVELIVLTNDASFLHTLRAEIAGARRVWHAPSADTVGDLLRAGEVGILIADAEAVAGATAAGTVDPGALVPFLVEIKRQFPQLVILIAGGRDMEAEVAALLSEGAVHRFLHKPLSPGRAKLFTDAAVKKLDELRRITLAQAPVRAGAPHRRRWMLGASAVLALALTVGALVIQGQSSRGPRAQGADASPDAGPVESPLLARAAAALAANRLTAPAGDNALELYRRALAAAPISGAARTGLAETRNRLFAAAQDAVLEDRLGAAAAAIDVARRAGVDSGRIALLSTELAKSRQQIGAIEARSKARSGPASPP